MAELKNATASGLENALDKAMRQSVYYEDLLYFLSSYRDGAAIGDFGAIGFAVNTPSGKKEQYLSLREAVTAFLDGLTGVTNG